MSETDEDKCVRILATFGLEISRAAASPPVGPDAVDEETWILAASGSSATASPPVGPDSAPRADLVRPAPPALRILAGVAWKVVNLPFYLVAGGIGVLQLGARAFNRALNFFRLCDTKATHLPGDILLDIAARLGPPRSNIQAMRSTCQAWRGAVPITNGPLLMMSSSNEEIAQYKILALRMTLSEAGAVSLVQCPFFSRPYLGKQSLLPNASIWGANNGLLALQSESTSRLYLFCMNCGENHVHLPQLPYEYTTGSRLEMEAEVGGIPNGGVFFHNLPISRLAILFKDYPTLFTDQRIDGYGHRQWAFYPGTEDTPMSSIGFLGTTHFVVVSDDLVVVGPVQVMYPVPGNWFDSPLPEPLVSLDIPAERPPAMEPWGSYGSHVFTCGERVYVCIMLRSVSDEDEVCSQVYSLDRLPSGDLALVRAYDIGNFAVYLGANQALVLPATESKIQRANTIYIPDDDGLNITARVWSVHIASGETDSFMFPPGVNARHYGRAAWAAPPPPLNMAFWHCDTTMAR